MTRTVWKKAPLSGGMADPHTFFKMNFAYVLCLRNMQIRGILLFLFLETWPPELYGRS
jgi:hypothetical protein